MTCNDCLYYEACTGWVEPDDLMKHNKPETCESFKNKDDFMEVVHAKWEINSDGYYLYCSNCKTEPKNGVMSKRCPECGAKMDGGKTE